MFAQRSRGSQRGSNARRTQKSQPRHRGCPTPNGTGCVPQPGLLPGPAQVLVGCGTKSPIPAALQNRLRKFLSSAETLLVWESLELITNRLSNFGSLELIKLASLAIPEA